jgi:hypothetical protein
MPIRAPAVRALVRSMFPKKSDLIIDLYASLIAHAVLADEAAQRDEAYGEAVQVKGFTPLKEFARKA